MSNHKRHENCPKDGRGIARTKKRVIARANQSNMMEDAYDPETLQKDKEKRSDKPAEGENRS